jgi:hypothetical protein
MMKNPVSRNHWEVLELIMSRKSTLLLAFADLDPVQTWMSHTCLHTSASLLENCHLERDAGLDEVLGARHLLYDVSRALYVEDNALHEFWIPEIVMLSTMFYGIAQPLLRDFPVQVLWQREYRG